MGARGAARADALLDPAAPYSSPLRCIRLRLPRCYGAPQMSKRVVIALMAALLSAVGACKKKEQAKPEAAVGSAADAVTRAPNDLANAPELEGVTWKRIEVPFGSLELPQDPGWGLVGASEVHGPDGIVIVMQAQDKVAPDRFDKYLTAFVAVQKRDAPKYELTAQTKGTVNGELAARVEGTFDNGTRFVTRDFVIFTKGKVVLVGARMPEATAAKLPSLVGHVARSLQVKER